MLFLSRRQLYQGAAYIVPILFIATTTLITRYVQHIYQTTEELMTTNQTKFTANEFAENLRQQFLHRLKILKISAESNADLLARKKFFDKTTPIIVENTPGFLALNWVSPDGYIRWVFPESPNKAALNKKLLDREDVRKYLIESRESRQSLMSHAVDLYQGPKGVTMYIPIYDKNNFKGWYNGVIDIEKFLNNFLARKSVQNLHLSFQWKGHENYIFHSGKQQKYFKKFKFEIPILNQTLLADMDFLIDSGIAKRSRQMDRIFISMYVSIFVISAFLFYLIRSQFTFIKLNEKLTRDRTIINVLSHDMATPLSLITESTRCLKEKLKGQEIPDIDRILRSSEKQTKILNRVRSFHATNIGKIHIELQPVAVSELISEAINYSEDAFKAKNISYQVEHKDGILYCLTDRLTAVDNVLGNVLSNAIKFSESDSEIMIRTYKDQKCVVIEIEDKGCGIPKNVLKQIFDEGSKTSRKGTKGESGTGLGMLQIKAFMEYYKGSVKIHTSETGTKVQLYFKSADIKT